MLIPARVGIQKIRELLGSGCVEEHGYNYQKFFNSNQELVAVKMDGGTIMVEEKFFMQIMVMK